MKSQSVILLIVFLYVEVAPLFWNEPKLFFSYDHDPERILEYSDHWVDHFDSQDYVWMTTVTDQNVSDQWRFWRIGITVPISKGNMRSWVESDSIIRRYKKGNTKYLLTPQNFEDMVGCEHRYEEVEGVTTFLRTCDEFEVDSKYPGHCDSKDCSSYFHGGLWSGKLHDMVSVDGEDKYLTNLYNPYLSGIVDGSIISYRRNGMNVERYSSNAQDTMFVLQTSFTDSVVMEDGFTLDWSREEPVRNILQCRRMVNGDLKMKKYDVFKKDVGTLHTGNYLLFGPLDQKIGGLISTFGEKNVKDTTLADKTDCGRMALTSEVKGWKEIVGSYYFKEGSSVSGVPKLFHDDWFDPFITYAFANGKPYTHESMASVDYRGHTVVNERVIWRRPKNEKEVAVSNTCECVVQIGPYSRDAMPNHIDDQSFEVMSCCKYGSQLWGRHPRHLEYPMLAWDLAEENYVMCVGDKCVRGKSLMEYVEPHYLVRRMAGDAYKLDGAECDLGFIRERTEGFSETVHGKIASCYLGNSCEISGDPFKGLNGTLKDGPCPTLTDTNGRSGAYENTTDASGINGLYRVGFKEYGLYPGDFYSFVMEVMVDLPYNLSVEINAAYLSFEVKIEMFCPSHYSVKIGSFVYLVGNGFFEYDQYHSSVDTLVEVRCGGGVVYSKSVEWFTFAYKPIVEIYGYIDAFFGVLGNLLVFLGSVRWSQWILMYFVLTVAYFRRDKWSMVLIIAFLVIVYSSQVYSLCDKEYSGADYARKDELVGGMQYDRHDCDSKVKQTVYKDNGVMYTKGKKKTENFGVKGDMDGDSDLSVKKEPGDSSDAYRGGNVGLQANETCKGSVCVLQGSWTLPFNQDMVGEFSIRGGNTDMIVFKILKTWLSAKVVGDTLYSVFKTHLDCYMSVKNKGGQLCGTVGKSRGIHGINYSWKDGWGVNQPIGYQPHVAESMDYKGWKLNSLGLPTNNERLLCLNCDLTYVDHDEYVVMELEKIQYQMCLTYEYADKQYTKCHDGESGIVTLTSEISMTFDVKRQEFLELSSGQRLIQQVKTGATWFSKSEGALAVRYGTGVIGKIQNYHNDKVVDVPWVGRHTRHNKRVWYTTTQDWYRITSGTTLESQWNQEADACSIMGKKKEKSCKGVVADVIAEVWDYLEALNDNTLFWRASLTPENAESLQKSGYYNEDYDFSGYATVLVDDAEVKYKGVKGKLGACNTLINNNCEGCLQMVELEIRCEVDEGDYVDIQVIPSTECYTMSVYQVVESVDAFNTFRCYAPNCTHTMYQKPVSKVEKCQFLYQGGTDHKTQVNTVEFDYSAKDGTVNVGETSESHKWVGETDDGKMGCDLKCRFKKFEKKVGDFFKFKWFGKWFGNVFSEMIMILCIVILVFLLYWLIGPLFSLLKLGLTLVFPWSLFVRKVTGYKKDLVIAIDSKDKGIMDKFFSKEGIRSSRFFVNTAGRWGRPVLGVIRDLISGGLRGREVNRLLKWRMKNTTATKAQEEDYIKFLEKNAQTRDMVTSIKKRNRKMGKGSGISAPLTIAQKKIVASRKQGTRSAMGKISTQKVGKPKKEEAGWLSGFVDSAIKAGVQKIYPSRNGVKAATQVTQTKKVTRKQKNYRSNTPTTKKRSVGGNRGGTNRPGGRRYGSAQGFYGVGEVEWIDENPWQDAEDLVEDDMNEGETEGNSVIYGASVCYDLL